MLERKVETLTDAAADMAAQRDNALADAANYKLAVEIFTGVAVTGVAAAAVVHFGPKIVNALRAPDGAANESAAPSGSAVATQLEPQSGTGSS